MEQLLLINPRKRRKSKAARPKARRRNPVRARRHKRRSPVAASAAPRRRRHNPIHRIKHRMHKRRRNPLRMPGMSGIMGQTVMPSITGTMGALGLDLLYGFLPIPATMKVGIMGTVTKAVSAIGLGLLAGMVIKKETANKMAVGALTVTLHDFAKSQLQGMFPTLALGDLGNFGYYSPGFPVGNAEQIPYSGANSVTGQMSGVGFYTDQSAMGEYVHNY